MSYQQATYSPGPAQQLVFSCAVEADGPGVTRVTLAGELDLATVPQLRAVLSEAAKDAELVIVDLSELTFMDSTGILMILIAHSQIRAADRRLALVPGPRQVQRIFELTGLDDKLSFMNNGYCANDKRAATGEPGLPTSTSLGG